jgi:hypothetical protein
LGVGGTCGAAICGIATPEIDGTDIGGICGVDIPGICGPAVPGICGLGAAGICGSCTEGICGIANPDGVAPEGPVDAAVGPREAPAPDAPPEMILVNSLGPLGTADVNGAGSAPRGTKTWVAPPAVERGIKVSPAGTTTSLFNAGTSGRENTARGSGEFLENWGMTLDSFTELDGRLNVPGSALSSGGAISGSPCTCSGINIRVKAPGLRTGVDAGLKSSSGSELEAG